MAEAGFLPRSPLAGALRQGHHGRPGTTGVLIQERDLDVVILAARRGQGAAVAEVVRRIFGLELPSTPRRVGDDRLAFLWAGEARWTAMADDRSDDLESRLRQALDGSAAVTGQGDGRVVLRLSGPSVRPVLAKAVAIDLHPRAFRPGDVALAPAFHIPVQLWLADDGSAFDLSVPSSYGATMLGWLVAAGAEYGVEVEGAD